MPELEPPLAAPGSTASGVPSIELRPEGGDELHASRHDAATKWPKTSVRVGKVIGALKQLGLSARRQFCSLSRVSARCCEQAPIGDLLRFRRQGRFRSRSPSDRKPLMSSVDEQFRDK